MSLDFCKAFDLLDPCVTRAALVHVGWDARLVRLLTVVWQQQQRFVTYGSHTAARLLIGPAMAQGDPFGPLIMAIWTWLGWLRVENVCSGVSLTRIYVDDRTFVCSSASDIHERFIEWERWSSSVGLLENKKKAVCIGSNPRRREQLRRILPDHVAHDVELLGACSKTDRRSFSGKEALRIASCRKVIWLLACIGLPFRHLMHACRSFAVSRAAYGWITRPPGLSCCVRLWQQVHVASRRCRSASPWLRAAVLGGGFHLDILFATQLISCLCKVSTHRPLVWTTGHGSPSWALNRWLIDHGWRLLAPWHWRFDVVDLVLDLRSVRDASWPNHVVRMGWRVWCLLRHAAADRRDSDILDCVSYCKKVNYDLTRAWALSCLWQTHSVHLAGMLRTWSLGSYCLVL